MESPTFVAIFFFLTVMLITGSLVLSRHKERMTILQKGVSAEDIKALYGKPFRAVNSLSNLKWGIVLIMVGAALLLGMWLREAYYLDEAVVPGLMAVFGGAGLVVFYVIAGRKASD